MDAGRKLGGTPDVAEGLLVEAIGLIVNQDRDCPEILSTLIAQIETLPCKAKGYFISDAIGDMQGAFVRERSAGRRPAANPVDSAAQKYNESQTQLP